MNTVPRAAKILRTLPDEDAARILDAAGRAARSDRRRLLTITVDTSCGPVDLMIGKPVSGDPVLLTMTRRPRPP